MPLQAIADGLWQKVDHLRFPGGVRLPAAMTVVRLADGALALHSPVRIDDREAAAIDALGSVRHIVAPNCFHHLFVAAAHARWPHAALHGAPGLARKRPDLRWTCELGDVALPEFGAALEQVWVRGAPRLNEVVFFHRDSATLLTTDLIFHVREPLSWPTRLALTTMGTRDRLAQSRLWWWYARDRSAFLASVDKLTAWPFRRVTMSHGSPVEVGPRELLAAMWMCRDRVPALPGA